MKRKRFYLLIFLILICLTYICFEYKKAYLKPEDVLGVYINNELSDKMPLKGEALFQKAVCDDTSTKVTWDKDKWGLLISNLNQKIKCNLYFYSGKTVFDFDYTGGEQTFVAPVSGTYKLETWGAEGGTYKEEYHGGYGGYSEGKLNLSVREGVYISVGGAGIGGKATESKNYGDGGYNGGGSRSGYSSAGELGSSGGGGATHIATKSGLLSALENYENNILIVSGGGGGAGYVDGGWNYNPTNIPSGGGFSGNAGQSEASRGGLPGTQNSGGLFGQGENCGDINVCDGGGGGYHGGKQGHSGAGGGSGYIGNPLLTNKVMYCYNCEESSEESTKTISTTCNEETPTSNCAKKGNGYARITLVSIDE